MFIKGLPSLFVGFAFIAAIFGSQIDPQAAEVDVNEHILEEFPHAASMVTIDNPWRAFRRTDYARVNESGLVSFEPETEEPSFVFDLERFSLITVAILSMLPRPVSRVLRACLLLHEHFCQHAEYKTSLLVLAGLVSVAMNVHFAFIIIGVIAFAVLL